MANKQIVIDKYFYMMRDEIGRIFGIQEIGDTRQLIKDIREQNEYIQAKEQECEELKTLLNVKEQKLIKIKQYIEDHSAKRTTETIFKIYNPKPIVVKKHNLPLDPYVLGA